MTDAQRERVCEWAGSKQVLAYNSLTGNFVKELLDDPELLMALEAKLDTMPGISYAVGHSNAVHHDGWTGYNASISRCQLCGVVPGVAVESLANEIAGVKLDATAAAIDKAFCGGER